MYANAVQILFGPWDLMLDFSHIAPVQKVVTGEDGEQTVETSVATQAAQRVVMSPQHAKALFEILRQNLETYEGQYGEIPNISLS